MPANLDKDALVRLSQFAFTAQCRLRNDLHSDSLEVSLDEIDLLKNLEQEPLTIDEIIASYPTVTHEKLSLLLKSQTLIPAGLDENRDIVVHFVDIETCRACNASCSYCPQSVSPKTQSILPMEHFYNILEQVSAHPIKWIALNHYNEPLMDPLFEQRIEALKKFDLKLRLFTNGALMTKKHCEMLRNCHLDTIVFNFPSVDPAAWSTMMGIPARLHIRAVQAIRTLKEFASGSEAKTDIAVNLLDPSQMSRVQEIKDFFGEGRNFQVAPVYTNSRAGNLITKNVASSHFTGSRAAGCKRVANHIHISWRGDIYLCCQDYNQDHVFGNIIEDPLCNILSSQSMKSARREIYGCLDLPQDSICRKCTSLRTERFLL